MVLAAQRLTQQKELAKRSTFKHAPTEVTSKRPVPRRRAVVDVHAVQPRDPRFLPLTGELSARKFREQYGFLAETRESELKTVQEHVKRARKLLVGAPKEHREVWERELSGLELAKKRAESTVNRDRREREEREALSRLTKEEREKRKKGKNGWWMKKSDKKIFLVRARYDVISATGGKRAIRKAIERKQKKISATEKKSKPFPPRILGGIRYKRKSVFTSSRRVDDDSGISP